MYTDGLSHPPPPPPPLPPPPPRRPRRRRRRGSGRRRTGSSTRSPRSSSLLRGKFRCPVLSGPRDGKDDDGLTWTHRDWEDEEDEDWEIVVSQPISSSATFPTSLPVIHAQLPCILLSVHWTSPSKSRDGVLESHSCSFSEKPHIRVHVPSYVGGGLLPFLAAGSLAPGLGIAFSSYHCFLGTTHQGQLVHGTHYQTKRDNDGFPGSHDPDTGAYCKLCRNG